MRPLLRRRGVSLIEALIALVVLSLGMVGIARLQTRVQQSAEIAAQRSHALRLAQREMEQLRARAAASPPVDEDPGTRYWLEQHLDGDGRDGWHDATVSVHWLDRGGEAQQVVLQSAMGDAPLALSGALALPRVVADALPVHGRSPRVPLAARDRGDGRSVLSVGGPGGAPALAFVFDNASGRITAVCADATRPERDCTATDALLLAGWVRFSLGVPPDPLRATDPPLSLDVALEATQGTLVAPGCRTEARHDGLAYHCAVAPAAGAWSGRSVLVPEGWMIGTAPRRGTAGWPTIARSYRPRARGRAAVSSCRTAGRSAPHAANTACAATPRLRAPRTRASTTMSIAISCKRTSS